MIAPGRTIRDKTVANFTAGHRKSLLGSMAADPLVITADNFDTPAIRGAIDDDTKVKLYVFTVQSLLQLERATTAKPTLRVRHAAANFVEQPAESARTCTARFTLRGSSPGRCPAAMWAGSWLMARRARQGDQRSSSPPRCPAATVPPAPHR